MRLTLSRKIFGVFFLLTSLSVLMGAIVLVGLNNFSSLQEKGEKINQFRLQAQNMRVLQREAVLWQTSDKEEEMGAALTIVSSLAADIDHLLQWHNLNVAVGSGSLSGQVDFYRQAFLELSRLYKQEKDFFQGNNELLEVIEKRVSSYSQDTQARLQEIIVRMVTLQIEMHYARTGESLNQLKSQAKLIGETVGDPALMQGIRGFITNIEQNYLNYMAVQDRENFLEETSNNFERISMLASKAIKDEIKATHRFLAILIVSFSIVVVVVTLIFWRVIAIYFNKFVAAHSLAVGAIRTGDFDFTLPETSKDELGDQLHFVKEVALNLKEKLTQLAASEEKFRGLVENISDWTWSIDQNGFCLYSSPKSFAIIGRDAESIVGRPVKEIFGFQGRIGAEDNLLKAIKAGKPFDDLVHRVEFGDRDVPLDIETSGRPIRKDDGTFQGFRFISRDISEQRRNEEIFRKQAHEQQLFNEILGLSLADISFDELLDRFIGFVLDSSRLELLPTGAVFLVDKEKRVLELKAHRGLDVHLQTNCKKVPFGVCICGRAAQSGKVVFSSDIDERHEIRHEGMHMHGHYSVPIHSVAGEVIGVFTVYIKAGSDINSRVESILSTATTILGGIIRRRQAEEQIGELNQNLERLVDMRTSQLSAANEELDSFAYSVSHDLRAPLRAIDGFSLALLEDFSDKLDSEGLEYLDRVRNGCLKMDQFIEDILKMSRITRGDIKKKHVNLSDMAHDVCTILQEGDPGRQVEVHIEKGLEAQADPVMIRAVLDNLLGNAWKYSAKTDKAVIQVGCGAERGKKEFYIRDNGAGFDMRYKEKLFAVFQRLHSSDDFQGTGIGLATVQRILHRHGGGVRAEGEEGKGATFFFWL